jgi:hypothetical protein
MYVNYTTDRPDFSKASHRCSSLDLSVGSLTWLTYTLWEALSR